MSVLPYTTFVVVLYPVSTTLIVTLVIMTTGERKNMFHMMVV